MNDRCDAAVTSVATSQTAAPMMALVAPCEVMWNVLRKCRFVNAHVTIPPTSGEMIGIMMSTMRLRGMPRIVSSVLTVGDGSGGMDSSFVEIVSMTLPAK